MTMHVHGEVAIQWCDRVCLSILDGAFNEAGVAHWFELLKQHWQQQGGANRVGPCAGYA